MGQHVLSEVDDGENLLRADLPPAQLDRGLDGRQGEALNPVAIELKISHLGGEEAPVNLGRVMMVAGEQGAELGIGALEDRLVVPEGIIGVQADRGDHGRTMTPVRRRRKGKENAR